MSTRIIKFNVDPDHVGIIIGTNGSTIRRLRLKYHSDIEINGKGEVEIFDGKIESMRKAAEDIQLICRNKVDWTNKKTAFFPPKRHDDHPPPRSPRHGPSGPQLRRADEWIKRWYAAEAKGQEEHAKYAKIARGYLPVETNNVSQLEE